MISFKNPGTMDLTAATTFGVSVKENANPIGFFGTGFKYAVAIVLRLGGRVVLWIGKERHEFTSRPEMVRGEEFQVVCLDNKPLGFTTHMGVTWEPWMAFREFYCNALDEGGRVEHGAADPEDGFTTLHISGALEDAYHERDTIVLSDKLEPIYKDEFAEIFPGDSQYMYYRRVRMGKIQSQHAALHTYNINRKQDITEDRTLANWAMVQIVLAQTIASSEDAAFIERIIMSPEQSFEHELDMNWHGVNPSKVFLDTVGKLRKDLSRPMNKTALYIHNNHRKFDAMGIEPCALNEIENKMLGKALAFLSLLGHDIDPTVIRPVESLGPDVMGMVFTGQRAIFIARKTFDMGTKQLAGTLLEEHIHLTKGHADCTRQFQNWLIDSIISIGERFVGEPL